MYLKSLVQKYLKFCFQAPGAPQENLNALQRAIDSMEEKGLQEDPRYSQLLALRARQGSMEPPRPVQVRYCLQRVCVIKQFIKVLRLLTI